MPLRKRQSRRYLYIDRKMKMFDRKILLYAGVLLFIASCGLFRPKPQYIEEIISEVLILPDSVWYLGDDIEQRIYRYQHDDTLLYDYRCTRTRRDHRAEAGPHHFAREPRAAAHELRGGHPRGRRWLPVFRHWHRHRARQLGGTPTSVHGCGFSVCPPAHTDPHHVSCHQYAGAFVRLA